MTLKPSKHMTFKAALTTSVMSIFLTTSPSNAADPNNQPRIPEKVWNFECVSEGWMIKVHQFDTGQDHVLFDGDSVITETLRELPDGWAQDPNLLPLATQAIHFPPIVQDTTKPNNGLVCDTSDNSVIGYGQPYVVLRRRNEADWSSAYIEWEGQARELIGLNAGEVLEKFRKKFERDPNAVPLPPKNMCTSFKQDCVSLNTPIYDRSPDAFAIMDMLYHKMEADIQSYLDYDSWGENLGDLKGLSTQWVKTLDALGIANADAIRENMRPRPGKHGTYIFRRLESTYTGLTLKVMDDIDIPLVKKDEFDNITFIVPSKTTNAPGTSWPTSNHVDQLQPGFFGRLGHRYPNPDYCAENDPNNAAYIPQYMSDPDVLLELGLGIKYLTDSQISLIESKGWRITEAMKHWTSDDFQNSIPNNPSLRRATYDCILPASAMATSSNGAQRRSALSGGNLIIHLDSLRHPDAICKIKDIAYYDELIERMIIVNPIIGNVINHPCNARKLTGTMSESIHLPAQKMPAIRAPIKSAPQKVRRSQVRKTPLPTETNE